MLRREGRASSIVCLHVDDVRVTGGEKGLKRAAEFMHRFSVSRVERGGFVYLGLRIARGGEGDVTMRHRAYVHGMGQIPVAHARGGGKTAPRTSEGATSLRRALGALQWLAGQTLPGISAEASMLQSAFQPPAVGDLLKVDKLIRRAEATDHASVRFRSAVGARGSMLMVFSDAPLQNAPLGGGGPR